jgi:hypothetical protein
VNICGDLISITYVWKIGGSNPSLLTQIIDYQFIMEKTIRRTSLGVVQEMLHGCVFDLYDSILEPSAGSGDLIEGILQLKPFHQLNLNLDCIELNKELREQLRAKGYNVVGEDFLKFNSKKRYDYVIACPTFKDNIDVEHIMHMYRFVKIGGHVISLTSPHWTVKNSTRQVAFREWLKDKHYQLRMLPDNSFVEDYKTQPSMIINIKRGQL